MRRTGWRRRTVSCKWAIDPHSHPSGLSSIEAKERFPQDTGVLRGSREGVGTLWAIEGAWALRDPSGNPEP